MKTVIALLFLAFELHSQIIYFPDPALKARLLQSTASTAAASPNVFNTSADLNHNGEIEIAEAHAVFGLNLSNGTGEPIHSLQGLQHFVNLRVLYCNNHSLTTIVPVPSSIQVLEIAGNSIEFLDLQEYPQIKKLGCSNNPIAVIDLDELWNLRELTICNTMLTELDCRMSGITRLDCADNANLSYINIQNSFSWSASTKAACPLNFSNLPSLNQVCIDSSELWSLRCSAYDAGKVTVYELPNCATGKQAK